MDGDKEFLNSFEEELEKANASEVPEEDITEPEGELEQGEEESESEEQETESEDDDLPEEDDPEGEEDPEGSDDKGDVIVDPEADPTEEDDEPEGEPEPEPSKEVDKSEAIYKEFYKTITAPFKANGKTIEVRSAEEAIRLMQMGANYTVKMQEISQHRKHIATLVENGITTTEEITFLIELKNKNPEAIKKYFKDAGLDPFDVDINSEVNYKPTTRVVSDKDLNAREVLDNLRTTPEGSATINYIADNWDNESTAFLWENPQMFNVIHEQRESGVFQSIMDEVERQTTLGILPPGGSILEKYHAVGNQLYGNAGQSQPRNARRPIDTRVASRSSAKGSNRRAKAASSPRASKRTSIVLDDLVGLDDDEFLKAMKSKL